jgi:hypothetical protein
MSGFLTRRQLEVMKKISTGMFNILIVAIRMYVPMAKSITAMTTSHRGRSQ